MFVSHPVCIFEVGTVLKHNKLEEVKALRIDIGDCYWKYWVKPDSLDNKDVTPKFLLQSLIRFYQVAVVEILEKACTTLGGGKRKFRKLYTREGKPVTSLLEVPPTAEVLLVSVNEYMPLVIKERNDLKIEQNELKEAFLSANRHNKIYSEVRNVFGEGQKKVKPGVSLQTQQKLAFLNKHLKVQLNSLERSSLLLPQINRDSRLDDTSPKQKDPDFRATVSTFNPPELEDLEEQNMYPPTAEEARICKSIL